MHNNLSVSRLIPNFITIFGLCSGLTSIKFILLGAWENAVIFILIAVVLDGFDGKIARLLNSSSNFGAQLDSLSDAMSCGIAPSLLIYRWHLAQMNFVGWYIAMVYAVCIIIRLARFNSNLENSELSENRKKKKKNFVGLASPMAALLVITPLMLKMGDLDFIYNFFFKEDLYFIFYILGVSWLTISHIRTPAVGNFKIPRQFISLFLSILAILIFAIFIKPWYMIPILVGCYVVYIPIYNGLIYWKKLRIKRIAS